MNLYKSLLIALGVIFSLPIKAENLTIAAAADLKYAMEEMVSDFKKRNPTANVETTYGSSGKIFTQIQQGAPFDMFFSADLHYPKELYKNGFASTEAKFLALGRIVLWSSSLDTSKITLQSLPTNTSIKNIAIANPKHAPYGKRAEEALKATGVWDGLQGKFVFGENISQTAQFALTGNAQVGIIALALALNPEMSSRGNYTLIPDNLHSPLEQGFVILSRAKDNKTAKLFADYTATKSAKAILTKYGFVVSK